MIIWLPQCWVQTDTLNLSFQSSSHRIFWITDWCPADTHTVLTGLMLLSWAWHCCSPVKRPSGPPCHFYTHIPTLGVLLLLISPPAPPLQRLAVGLLEMSFCAQAESCELLGPYFLSQFRQLWGIAYIPGFPCGTRLKPASTRICLKNFLQGKLGGFPSWTYLPHLLLILLRALLW